MNRHHACCRWAVTASIVTDEYERFLHLHGASETVNGLDVDRGMDVSRHLSNGDRGNWFARSCSFDDRAEEARRTDRHHGDPADLDSEDDAFEHG